MARSEWLMAVTRLLGGAVLLGDEQCTKILEVGGLGLDVTRPGYRATGWFSGAMHRMDRAHFEVRIATIADTFSNGFSVFRCLFGPSPRTTAPIFGGPGALGLDSGE